MCNKLKFLTKVCNKLKKLINASAKIPCPQLHGNPNAAANPIIPDISVPKAAGHPGSEYRIIN